MIIRRVAVVGIVLAGMLALGGCDGSPAPAASTPPFASEEEAFAAAEETYRAYVDALNARRHDSSASPSPADFLTAAALEADLSAQEQLRENGIRIAGDTRVDAFEGRSWDGTAGTSLVCLDATDTQVLNDEGVDVTPPDRELRSTLRIGFVLSAPRVLISSTESAGESIC